MIQLRPAIRPLALALLLGTPLAASAQLRVTVSNPLAIERRDEIIALPWARVTAAMPGASASAVRAVDASGNELATQVLDADADGKPDSLLVLADFWPSEVKTLVVEAQAPRRAVAPRVHVRHDDPRDDVAWESDRIAFRIYGQGLKKTSSAMSSSGIDVWVKSVHSLIVEKWYGKGHDSYHIDTGEGADFYDVGETLGNGGTALWAGDSLYRADNFTSYRIIANGPIRGIFELTYAPWGPRGQRVSETKRFVIDAGRNLYRQESTFRREDGGAAEPISYAIGTLKRPGMVGTMSRAQPWAWLTGWGPVAPKNGGHGELGTAVLIPRDRLLDWKETGDHYLAISRARSGEPVVHYIGAGWTASHDFASPQEWWAYLDDAARRLAAPLRVSMVTP